MVLSCAVGVTPVVFGCFTLAADTSVSGDGLACSPIAELSTS